MNNERNAFAFIDYRDAGLRVAFANMCTNKFNGKPGEYRRKFGLDDVPDTCRNLRDLLRNWLRPRRGGAAVFLALCVSAAVVAPAAAQVFVAGSQESYYARRSLPIWFANGLPTAAANALPPILLRAQLDGLPDGPVLAAQVRTAIRTAAEDPNLSMQMDKVLSSAWVRYVQTMEAPLPAFEYTNEWMAPPRVATASEILNRASTSGPVLLEQVLKTASGNPIYSALRDAAWNNTLESGNLPAANVIANLARVRFRLPQKKSIVVDARAAVLYMFNHGQLVGTMRVIVGKPQTPTPLVVSIISGVTVNPYWNVPADLVQQLIAPRVLSQGVSYIKDHKYQVVTTYGSGAIEISPNSVDWKAVASGNSKAMVRQLPGRANSMGKLKFGFVNANDIYLHDTPNKGLFDQKERLLSNGCVRLEDAQRVARWLLEQEPKTSWTAAEKHELLPEPVPIYVTYLTVRADGGKLKFETDVYGRDATQRQPGIAPQ